MSYSCNKHGWTHIINPCPCCNNGLTYATNSAGGFNNPAPLPADISNNSDKLFGAEKLMQEMANDLFKGEGYTDARRNWIYGFDAAVENLYRPALDELKNLTRKGEELCQQNGELLMRIAALEAVAKQMAEIFEKLRSDSSLWKAPRYGGQDCYAGMPPAMRFIDEALDAYRGMK